MAKRKGTTQSIWSLVYRVVIKLLKWQSPNVVTGNKSKDFKESLYKDHRNLLYQFGNKTFPELNIFKCLSFDKTVIMNIMNVSLFLEVILVSYYHRLALVFRNRYTNPLIKLIWPRLLSEYSSCHSVVHLFPEQRREGSLWDNRTKWQMHSPTAVAKYNIY